MKITLLQWNVWYKEDIRNIVQFLKSNPTDIVCLQELTIDSPDQVIKDSPLYVADQLGYNYHYKDLPLDPNDKNHMKLANGIFSKFPISHSTYTWINQPQSSGGYDDEFRALVAATLDIDGRSLDVATAHMSYTHRFEGTARKSQETQALVKALEGLSNPTIFTGDLNATPGSETVVAIEQILDNAGPAYDQNTWTTKPFSYNGFEETELNWRLDYAFKSSSIKVLSSEVPPTDYSDHLPLLITFEY
jgi:endonuclease/exonuclease/phosphatase family metal-dependent hydrolase